MLLEVAVQVGLLAEAAVTQVALEGLLLVVDVADVTLQVGGDAEGAVTVFTPAGQSGHISLKQQVNKDNKLKKIHKRQQGKYSCATQ